jgi:predicted phosphohydrolase
VFESFVSGNDLQYDPLKAEAMRLGSAFQKVNFLRDLKDDNLLLNRNYSVWLKSLMKMQKSNHQEIEEDLELLPRNCEVPWKQVWCLHGLCLLQKVAYEQT